MNGIDGRQMGTQAGNIMQEVVQHLTSLYGTDVQITLQIQAKLPNGVPEGTVRSVTENCRTLKFEGFGFGLFVHDGCDLLRGD